ncbi:class A beta-lactamase [Oceanobacillus profundus]|uniref:class A beta-lactamase n=1 Tax=Oceanobacillus profundus TaxID=372463 RepID=UPI002559B038|nr:class A beta-lactamase [Oceanobacillus profundus]MBR3119083.1 class A beta-lactamase [Oceanobacillus sp.]
MVYSMGKSKFMLAICLMAMVALIGCAKETDSSESMSQSNNEETNQTTDNDFAQLEKEFDAKLGVYALDTGSGKIIDYQADERFAYTSTFKPLAAGAVLKQNSFEELNETVTYTEDDLVTYSPITEKHVDTGMNLLEISEAAIRYSDNTAGNLLFNELGGPDGLEKAMREIGDNVINSDRTETNLNEAKPGDVRDTSTPKALATSLQAFALDDQLLSESKQDMLLEWLKTNTTGDSLIRAGVPEDWTVGDKSGAGGYGTRNDIGIVWPPDREPIVIAILSNRDTEDAEYNDDLIKQATEITVDALK